MTPTGVAWFRVLYHQVLGMTYNLPYYQELFENYGFKLYYRQLSFHLDLEKPFPERFWKIAEWINKRKGYSYKHFDPKLKLQVCGGYRLHLQRGLEAPQKGFHSHGSGIAV